MQLLRGGFSILPVPSSFLKTKMPISLTSRKAWKLANLLSKKFASMRVISGHFNMKIAQVGPLEVESNLKDPTLLCLLSLEGLSQKWQTPRDYLSGSPSCNYTDNWHWTSFKLARSAGFYVTNAILINYKLMTNQNKSIAPASLRFTLWLKSS